jgi:hypothetical protein
MDSWLKGENGHTMTRSDISLLAVRLLALYLIVQGISYLPVVAQLWRPENEYMRASRVWSSVVMTAPIVLGLVMFVSSRVIAHWILPSEGVPDDPTAGVATYQSVAIGTFGLFLIAFAIPQLWSAILVLKENSIGVRRPKSFYEDPYVVGELVSLVLGVVLLTGARYWARLVARFRDLGYENDTT